MGLAGRSRERRRRRGAPPPPTHPPPPLRFRRFPASLSQSHAHLRGGLLFLRRRGHSVSPDSVLFHTFYFFIRRLRRTRARGRAHPSRIALFFKKQVDEVSALLLTEKYTFKADGAIKSLVILSYVLDWHCCFFLDPPFRHLKSKLVL